MNNQKPVIAVVGAGRMGIGIAQVFAYAGYQVKLIDAKERGIDASRQVLQASLENISSNLSLFQKLDILNQKKADQILGRIKTHQFWELKEVLPCADVVFEAVPEVLVVKEIIFGAISNAVGPQTLIASTTSTFLVDSLADFIQGPDRFMNTHWLNPAYLIPLVEVSPGPATSPEALQTMLGLLKEAGKVPVKCASSPGFIVPRIQALAMNEAARLVEEGVASPEDIDKASRLGFGLRFVVLGLLEFIDWGGGDILYYASSYLKDALQTDRFTPPDIVTKNMATGQTGLKSGRGFYDFAARDISAYQQETIKKFIGLLQHLGLFNLPEIYE